jgi:hypothetical protein
MGTQFCELCVNACSRLTETIFPRTYARMYYAPPRARVLSFSKKIFSSYLLPLRSIKNV